MHWTHGPGCTSDPCRLPRRTEGFLLPQAQPGSSLGRPPDLMHGNSAPWPGAMTEEMLRPPGPEGVGAGLFSNKWSTNFIQGF